MIEYYIYLGTFVICTFVLSVFLIGLVISSSKVAISNMEKEADTLIAQYNEIVDFIQVSESKAAMHAILLYLNAVNSRLTSLSTKANYTETSKRNYSASVKKFNALRKNLDKTLDYVLSERL